jgi:hypothetical protein
MTEITQRADSLKDALYALAMAKPTPDAGVLDDLVRRYPRHAAELTDMAVALALDHLQDGGINPVLPEISGRSEAVAYAMSRFHNRLYRVNASERAGNPRAETAAVNPFASLDRAELREIGTSIGANTVFVMKLRDAVIDDKTITPGFRKHLATKISVPLEVVAAHFARPALMPVTLHYKAEQKPTSGAKQSFEEAVRNSGLTPEQQAFLLGL